MPPLWLCWYFPNLPVEVFYKKNSNNIAENPLVVIEKNTIIFVSDSAMAQGVEPGMHTATVYALIPKLHIELRDIDTETKTISRLAQWFYQFTPYVALYKTFAIATEVSGSLRLFGGLKNLIATIQTGLQQKGHQSQLGIAHTPYSAWLLSQQSSDQSQILVKKIIARKYRDSTAEFFMPIIKKLPVALLDLSAKQQQKIANLGLSHIADVLALPSRQLGMRVGKEIINLIARIKGEKQESLPWIRPLKSFNEKIDFPTAVDQLDNMWPAVEQLLRQFYGYLKIHQLGVTLFSFKIDYYRLSSELITVEISNDNNRFAKLLELTRLSFTDYSFKAPIEAIALVSEDFREVREQTENLFAELSHPSLALDEFKGLLDVLASRLGRQNILLLAEADEHLPDHRQIVKPISQQSLMLLKVPQPMPQQNPGLEPLWLRKHPLKIQQIDNNTLHYRGPLRIVYDDQYIDSHWWAQRAQRHYVIVRSSIGVYYWAFQNTRTGEWYIHGEFG